MGQKKLGRYVSCEYDGTDLLEILAISDEEIARLTQVRALLAGKYQDGHDAPKRRLSAEARKRIADSERKRPDVNSEPLAI